MNIINSYQKKLCREDYLVMRLGAVLIVTGLIGILLNAVTFRYSGRLYFSYHWLWAIPVLLTVQLLATTYLEHLPNLAFLLKSYGLYFLALFAFLVMLTGVQYTPFPIIDPYLARADQALHINESSLVNWTYDHPQLLKFLRTCYNSITAQWVIIPLLLLLANRKQYFHLYLIVSLIAYFIGALLYYFFPILGAASIFNAAVYSFFDGGIIAFPYFHIMWSVIIIYIFLKTSPWLSIPIILINIITIAATLLLGWGYPADIVGGILVGGLAICLANRVCAANYKQASAIPSQGNCTLRDGGL